MADWLSFVPGILKLAPSGSVALSMLNSIGRLVEGLSDPGGKLHAISAIAAAYNPDYVMWIQGSLNRLVTPTPNLDVDGLPGPLTRAAIEQFQRQLGLPADGWVYELTQAAIQTALYALDVAQPQSPVVEQIHPTIAPQPSLDAAPVEVAAPAADG